MEHYYPTLQYGPIWKRRKCIIEMDFFKSFPIPDGINCGPILDCKTLISDASGNN